MPKFYEDIDELKSKKKYACEGIRDDLLECLLKSDCCKKNKRTPRECMLDSTIPDECTRLRTALFECKRSMICERGFEGGKTTNGGQVIHTHKSVDVFGQAGE